MDIVKVGKAIAYLRKRAGYTQKELADRIGISDKAVSKWERGQGLPEIGYLRKLSILLDTDSDSLLAGDVAHHKSDWTGIIVLDENPYGIGVRTMIYDKPIINYLLSYFILVGIRILYIACTGTDAEYISNVLGRGEEYGIQITTVVGDLKDVVIAMSVNDADGLIVNKNSIGIKHNSFQSNSDNDIKQSDISETDQDDNADLNVLANDTKIKDDVLQLKDVSGNVMLVYGRCILYGVDQTRFFQKAMVDREHLIMMALPKRMQKTSFSVDVDKRVINDGVDDSKKRKLRTQYDFSEIPILFFPISFLSSIAAAPSINDYIEKQKERENIFIETLDRGFVEIEVNDWNNVQEASTFMKIVQDKCGMNVYCLEEVAWRRGMISLAKLKELGERKAGTEYGEYVLGLYDRLSGRVFEESEWN